MEFRDSLDALRIPRLTSQDPSWFDEGTGAQILKNHFTGLSIEDLGLSNVTTGLKAAGALLQYLKVTQPIADHQQAETEEQSPCR